MRRIIKEAGKPAEKVPKLPLLIALDNGSIGEAASLKDAVIFIIGDEYLDAEDPEDEYAYRLEHARKEAMRLLERNLNIKVSDGVMGTIQENYAAAPEDPDYQEDTDEPSLELYIRSEKTFLLSLVKINALSIFERIDSNLIKGTEEQLISEYEGGEYIDISKEYDIDHIIQDEIDRLKDIRE
ncbi:hypothetical protein IAI10_16555 [Clostridium sp. 19966]|uniref:hypothetical protein n=1 Tax=Clostridium sp. 19966 TaxID=2768166 RepID=UPI0028DDB2F0|nr:hypothetical protein [Clostridium sp. 19966]MDT8718280.1 hypothetical protein [Clostridium sp. 19966]